MINNSKRINTILFFLIYAISFGIVLNKCRYGFVNVDESLYVALPYRILQGDALFLNEWNLSQLMTIPLYPFLKAWFLTGHDLNGISLYWRYVYTVVNAVSGLILYSLFRKENENGAMCGALAFMIFAPYNIPALSYNSGAIIAITLSLAILWTSKRKLTDYIAGVLFGIGIICYPYAVVFYVYLVIVIFLLRPDRKWHVISFFTLGNATMLIVLLAAIFSRCSLAQLLKVIPIMVGGETEGHTGGIKYKLISFVPVILNANAFNKYLIIAFAACILGVIVLKKAPRRYFTYAAMAVTLAGIILSFTSENYINHLMVAISFCGLYFFAAYRQCRELFYFMWLPGILLSVVMHIQSNNGFYAISCAGAITIICSTVVICKGIKEEKEKPTATICMILCALIFIAQIGGELYIRANNVFWEEGLSVKDQTELISDGPSKGIYVTKEKKDLYYSYYNDVKEKVSDDEKVLFLTDKSWLYLFGAYENASYSPWTYGVVDVAVGMLEKYYEVNPDKKPTLIFVDREFTEYQPKMEEAGYHVLTKTEEGNLIMVQ